MMYRTLNWASVTLQKKNRALEVAKLKADKSNDLKSQFVANMSHEIRTPLNGILGLTEITLGNSALAEKPRRNLELIQLSAEHLLRVVNDILDFSKIDANRLDMDPQPFELRLNVQAMVKMVSSACKYGGTGLGLTITQRLLELMNSRIHLWSQEGVGSEFSFTLELPVVEQQTTTECEAPTVDMTSDNNPAMPEFGQAATGLRVLVAEDNMVNQTFISHVLTQLGISYRFADDGLAALQAVDQENFDLVFMDMHMPNMGGLEACRAILAKPQHKNLPIVGLTADAIADTREACMSAGMREYISKPFKRSDIEAVLARLKFKVSPIPMQNFDHDKELLKTTINMIAAEIPQLSDEAEKQLSAKNLPEAKRALHTLKGHCKLVGEFAFADFIQQLENQLMQNQLPAANSIERLKSNLRVLQQRLRLLGQ